MTQVHTTKPDTPSLRRHNYELTICHPVSLFRYGRPLLDLLLAISVSRMLGMNGIDETNVSTQHYDGEL
jgi:hypothetical protein